MLQNIEDQQEDYNSKKEKVAQCVNKAVQVLQIKYKNSGNSKEYLVSLIRAIEVLSFPIIQLFDKVVESGFNFMTFILKNQVAKSKFLKDYIRVLKNNKNNFVEDNIKYKQITQTPPPIKLSWKYWVVAYEL